RDTSARNREDGLYGDQQNHSGTVRLFSDYVCFDRLHAVLFRSLHIRSEQLDILAVTAVYF
ncbi:MAG: hypothetical protein D3904_01920, partial [Candidatus Electrothrix sp. EH2]|nr:hypothetical protein [Candidatus Electrothrix sp. EH2]